VPPPARIAGAITNTHWKSANAQVTIPTSAKAAARSRPAAENTSSTSATVRNG
jgi:hypothetical protein